MSTACHRHFNHLVPVWRSYPAGPAATEVQLLGAAGNQHLGEMGQKLGQRWGSRVWLEEFPPENRGMDVYRSDFLLPGPATDQPSGTRNLKDSAGTLVSHHTFGHGSLRPPWSMEKLSRHRRYQQMKQMAFYGGFKGFGKGKVGCGWVQVQQVQLHDVGISSADGQ